MTPALPLTHMLLALIVVAVWGSNFVVAHYALEQFGPLFMATLRFALSILPWILFVRRPAVPWRDLALYGLLGGFGQFGLLYIALQHDISPGLASLVIQMQAFFTLGLAVWLLRERVHLCQLVALALAAAGLILVGVEANGAATPRGLILTLLAGLCWAGANLVVRRAGPVNALAYVVWSSLFAVPPLFALALLAEGWSSIARAVTHADAFGWAAVVWQALGNSVFGFGVWSWLLARHPAGTVTPTAMLVPVFGLATSAVALHEPLQPWKIAAAALVLAGLAVNLLWPRVRRPSPGIAPQLTD
jgi:O-acetylserine/cysteine efflux transporter